MFWSFFFHAVGIFGGVGIGVLLAAVLGLAARTELRHDAMRAECKANLAHQIGDLMAAELAGELRRKDIKVKTRHRIGDLLLRWGALRPATTTGFVSGDYINSGVTFPESEGAKRWSAGVTATGNIPPGPVLRASATEAGVVSPTSQRVGEEVL